MILKPFYLQLFGLVVSFCFCLKNYLLFPTPCCHLLRPHLVNYSIIGSVIPICFYKLIVLQFNIAFSHLQIVFFQHSRCPADLPQSDISRQGVVCQANRIQPQWPPCGFVVVTGWSARTVCLFLSLCSKSPPNYSPRALKPNQFLTHTQTEETNVDNRQEDAWGDGRVRRMKAGRKQGWCFIIAWQGGRSLVFGWISLCSFASAGRTADTCGTETKHAHLTAIWWATNKIYVYWFFLVEQECHLPSQCHHHMLNNYYEYDQRVLASKKTMLLLWLQSLLFKFIIIYETI